MSEQEEKQTDPANINTELAKERTYAAYERTLLSWIRTSIALVGFGIGIFEFASRSDGTAIFKSSRLVGLLLILLGTTSVFMAIADVKKNNAQLSNPDFRYNRTTTLGVRIGYVLIVICLLAMINVIRKIIGQYF